MFNRTIFNSPDTIIQNTTIHERRAPTDESVKLLREMEEAAKQAIVSTTIVRNTEFECKIHKSFDVINMEDCFSIIYSLNGKKHHTQVRLYRESPEANSIEAVAKTLRDKVAHDIATVLLSSAFSHIESH